MGGIALQRAVVTDRGLEHDRRWMLIDANGRFISQRERPIMALFLIDLTPGGLLVTYAPKKTAITIPYKPLKGEMVTVTVWDDNCTAQLVSDDADRWFSDLLDLNCRLVYMADSDERLVDQRHASPDTINSFSDAYPFLLIGQASLDDLNSRLTEPLAMARFRPNIVFTGGEPFLEDRLHTFTINAITFHGVKLCARCVMITINQQTAETGKEPSKTLAGFRFKDNKILFGQNLTHEGTGTIKVGDALEVLQLHHDERFVLA